MKDSEIKMKSTHHDGIRPAPVVMIVVDKAESSTNFRTR